MSRSRTAFLAAVLVLWSTSPAFAHHGVAAVGFGGTEGPGAALETTSAIPLPLYTGFAMLKTENVSFDRYARAEPANKDFASFNTLVLGFGLRPWLSAYVFQPLNVKSQDAVGVNSHLGDTNLMLALGFKWDEGFRLVPEKESLDELMDWHFSFWASCTLPLGPTDQKDDQDLPFAPDMQTGFGSASPALGLTVLKQFSEELTWLVEASYQQFFPYDYGYTRYQFGGETRLNTALTWRLVARGAFRADLAAELLGLHLQRDKEKNDAGDMEAQQGSGGLIIYAGLGLRMSYGRWSLGLGAKRALPIHSLLNEGDEQQGSEGLETIRASASLGVSVPF
jgi:hypothetical protein